MFSSSSEKLHIIYLYSRDTRPTATTNQVKVVFLPSGKVATMKRGEGVASAENDRLRKRGKEKNNEENDELGTSSTNQGGGIHYKA